MAIPLTRLGGGGTYDDAVEPRGPSGDATPSAISCKLTRAAFNHRPDRDAEEEYDRLRGLARAEAEKRNDCFARSRQAYTGGDGALAKDLSNRGKEHAAAMAEYNRQARDYIFRANNAPGLVADDTIDLHGLFVEEAEDILEERIKHAQASGQTHLHVEEEGEAKRPMRLTDAGLWTEQRHRIVGKGNHSVDGVQKLKPRVEQVCHDLGLRYRTEENEGRIYVNLQGGEAVPPPDEDPYDPHHGHHHGHGGHHHHHQQQPQQEADTIEDLFSKFARKLADCCIIM
ncbi:hypothetical protein DL765_008007 [Monosporascus sp. GIB2]|nr:hypothetical protein DL765_008007 [Monosporascus sp. GIB2]